jgi:hypothetical protein
MIKLKRMKWAEHIARMEEKTNAYKVLVGREKGRRLLGRPRHTWEDSIKVNLKDLG